MTTTNIIIIAIALILLVAIGIYIYRRSQKNTAWRSLMPLPLPRHVRVHLEAAALSYWQ